MSQFLFGLENKFKLIKYYYITSFVNVRLNQPFQELKKKKKPCAKHAPIFEQSECNSYNLKNCKSYEFQHNEMKKKLKVRTFS